VVFAFPYLGALAVWILATCDLVRRRFHVRGATDASVRVACVAGGRRNISFCVRVPNNGSAHRPDIAACGRCALATFRSCFHHD
jgi:hypothetical protein